MGRFSEAKNTWDTVWLDRGGPVTGTVPVQGERKSFILFSALGSKLWAGGDVVESWNGMSSHPIPDWLVKALALQFCLTLATCGPFPKPSTLNSKPDDGVKKTTATATLNAFNPATATWSGVEITDTETPVFKLGCCSAEIEGKLYVHGHGTSYFLPPDSLDAVVVAREL